MSDIWIDVDAALTEVPVNILPLIDDTDFKTRETGTAFNAAGMDLVWNFTTTNGTFTQTPVTPTTGGDYDWVNQGKAMYTIEIPASGGASINNDSEGFGWFTGFITGILPWRSPVIGFRAAALNNALIDGGDVLDVSLTEMGGVAQSATDLKDFADAGYDPGTNKVQGVVLVDTTTVNTDMVGTDSALTDKAGFALTSAEHINIADALLKRDWNSVTGEAARSALNAFRFLRNKWSIAAATLTVTEEDDSTPAWTAAITDDATADPVTGVDPT